jgi:outer membrane protein W
MKIGASFGGQVGARVIGVFWGETKLGFDAKYFYGYPHLKTIEVGGHCTSATASSWQREWQVGVALSQTFAYFTPYIGANYSRFAAYFNNINSSLFSGDVSVVNTSPWGFVIGLGICADKGPFLDLEARFFDEYAFSAAAGMRF